jgi:hypothetical protein
MNAKIYTSILLLILMLSEGVIQPVPFGHSCMNGGDAAQSQKMGDLGAC